MYPNGTYSNGIFMNQGVGPSKGNGDVASDSDHRLRSDEEQQQPEASSHDFGLETFLHLLDPDLALPLPAVEPEGITLRLDKGDRTEVAIRIRNEGRGYLAGGVELEDDVPGLELSSHHFGLDSKAQQQADVTLAVDAGALDSGKEYRTSVVLSTNGDPDRIVVPVSLMAADRTERVREATAGVLLGLVLVVPVYGIGVWDRVASAFGLGSPLGVINAPVASVPEIQMLSVLLVGLGLLPAILLSGRNLRWYGWLALAGLAILVGTGLQRASNRGSPEVCWAFAVMAVLVLFPTAVVMAIVRLVYYRAPHLRTSLALGITIAVFVVCWFSLGSGLMGGLARQLPEGRPPETQVAEEIPVVETPVIGVLSKEVPNEREMESWAVHVGEGKLPIAMTVLAWQQIRDGPGVSYEVIARLYEAQELLVVAQRGQWYFGYKRDENTDTFVGGWMGSAFMNLWYVDESGDWTLQAEATRGTD